MGLEINTQTSLLHEIIITGLSSFGWWERKMVRKGGGSERKCWRLKRVQWTSLCASTSYPPSPVIPLLAGQCLCSDLLKHETKDFFFFLFFFPKWCRPKRPEAGSNESRPCEGGGVNSLCGVIKVFVDPVPPVPPNTPRKAQFSPDLSCLAEADGWTAGRLWWGRGSCVVFDEGDGCQLFAELLQHDHPLQQSHVVDAERTDEAD